MKFAKDFAICIIIGATIGSIVSQITIQPSITNHLIHWSIMLVLSILVGLVGGRIRK